MKDKDPIIIKEEGKGKPPIEKIDEGPTQPEERVQYSDKLEDLEEKEDPDEMMPERSGFARKMREKMEIALSEAKKAADEGEVPIGAALFYKGNLISKAHNRKETSNDPSAHAEILALREASKLLDDWRLEDCELYVTAEPCPMCLGAILQTRIDKLVYATEEPVYGAVESHRVLEDYPNLSQNLQIYGGATRS